MSLLRRIVLPYAHPDTMVSSLPDVAKMELGVVLDLVRFTLYLLLLSSLAPVAQPSIMWISRTEAVLPVP